MYEAGVDIARNRPVSFLLGTGPALLSGEYQLLLAPTVESVEGTEDRSYKFTFLAIKPDNATLELVLVNVCQRFNPHLGLVGSTLPMYYITSSS